MKRIDLKPATANAGHPSAPRQSWRWLRPLLPKHLQPALRGLRKRYQRMFMNLDEPYRSVFPFTQAHLVRQQNLVRLGEFIVKKNIPGAFVECGVLDGGTAALTAWASRSANPARTGLPTTCPVQTAASVPSSAVVSGRPSQASIEWR
jgi:hypothetical protein